jgi:hypothetical protein
MDAFGTSLSLNLRAAKPKQIGYAADLSGIHAGMTVLFFPF